MDALKPLGRFPGRLLYHAWHRPLGALSRCRHEGGPLEQWRTERGRRHMETAAWTLPALPDCGGNPLEVHVLTGRRFWYQTAFCLWTLAHHAGRDLAPCIYDDGTLTEEFATPLLRLFPAVRIVSQCEILARLDQHLPAARFPHLRERWLRYPNIRKLTDVHAGASGWKLVIDSDLLFFRKPEFLLAWLDHPDRPLHAVDSETSYGYPRELMGRLAGHELAELVNVGLCGLRSDALDWERLEHWCRTLIEGHGPHYFLEQALVAMLVAGQRCAVAPGSDYLTCPQPPEAADCRAVMHHYVADSKRWYFQRNWRRVLASAAR